MNPSWGLVALPPLDISISVDEFALTVTSPRANQYGLQIVFTAGCHNHDEECKTEIVRLPHPDASFDRIAETVLCRWKLAALTAQPISVLQ